jgi:tetratricopeptide (TPR) repeat protein
MAYDPQSITYPYELALVHYQVKEYQRAAQILDSLLKHPEVNEQVYQLLGNCKDNMDSTVKAHDIYQAGLEKYPNSGRLYMEMALIGQKLKKTSSEIINLTEKGIEVEPSFPYNYYYASNYYARTSEKIWGLFYAEIFMNIADNTFRISEISKILYEIYNSGIRSAVVSGESKLSGVKTFSSKSDETNTRRFESAFQIVFESSVKKYISDTSAVSLDLLNKIRKEIVSQWFAKKLNQKFPNTVMNWMKVLVDDGHFEAYNYFMFRDLNREEYKKWAEANRKQLGAFAKWADSHRLTLTESNRFFRYQYDR